MSSRNASCGRTACITSILIAQCGQSCEELKHLDDKALAEHLHTPPLRTFPVAALKRRGARSYRGSVEYYL
ncbi:MAG: hypothetical protein E6R08_10835 [Nevskiaceae bacterium]|nr:MAG: hypothetical protein E6R08_10835 [Nevskiaceae bacterium]